MKTMKNILKLLCLVLLSFCFSQCASTMKLQKEAPTIFGEVYFQNWVSGVRDGGSGTNVFIETKNKTIVLDSLYFRGDIVKFEVKPGNKHLFIGRFKSDTNTEKNDNTVKGESLKLKDFPFQLEENECVISYEENGKFKYFKIVDLKEKHSNTLPMSAPPNKN